MRQAATYETGGDTWDEVLKLVNTAFRDHPFHTVRAGALERWRTGGEYDAIVGGIYPRRSEPAPKLSDDYAEATSYYSGKMRRGFDNVSDAARRAADAFRDAFRGGPGTPASPPPGEPIPPV
jgi:hypothetical protein